MGEEGGKNEALLGNEDRRMMKNEEMGANLDAILYVQFMKKVSLPANSIKRNMQM